MRSNQVFGKRELVDTLSRDLARARNKRDTIAACVSTLTAQIAELEARLSAETARQARERDASVPLALASACRALGLRVGEDPAAARVAEMVIRFKQSFAPRPALTAWPPIVAPAPPSKQTSASVMSALPPKADIAESDRNVRFVPAA